MGRSTFSNYTSILDWYWNRARPGIEPLHDIVNNVSLSSADPTDTTSVHMVSVDTDSRVRLDKAAQLGAREVIQFVLKANGSLATESFFIADRAMVITAIQYDHSTAGGDAGAVTAVITHETSSSQAAGGGTVVQTNSFNCKATANTPQSATLLAVDGNGNPNTGITLAAGDRLSILFAGTLTSLAGVVVTVFCAPGFKEIPAVYVMNANSGIATQNFFQSNRKLTITGVSMIWGTAATDAGTVTLTLTKDTGTTAAGAGTALLAAAQSVKGAINTVVNPALTATASALNVNPGDRISIKTAGTLTALAGVVVVVYFAPIGTFGYIGEQDITYTMLSNTNIGTTEIFIADRDYEVVDASMIWGTAGTDGGTVTADVEVTPSGTAPGSGTSVTTGAVSVKTTAATTSVFALSTSRRNRLLAQGDAISVVFAGTLTALAGFTATVSLVPR